jgi:hypothetical protein
MFSLSSAQWRQTFTYLLGAVVMKKQIFSIIAYKIAFLFQEMFCSPKILAIRHCSELEKNFLRFLVTIFQKTGIEETALLRVYRCRMTFSIGALINT